MCTTIHFIRGGANPASRRVKDLKVKPYSVVSFLFTFVFCSLTLLPTPQEESVLAAGLGPPDHGKPGVRYRRETGMAVDGGAAAAADMPLDFNPAL
jgi:hypothetical protein